LSSQVIHGKFFASVSLAQNLSTYVSLRARSHASCQSQGSELQGRTVMVMGAELTTMTNAKPIERAATTIRKLTRGLSFCSR